MTFAIAREALAALHAHAREAYPDECCGMLVERDGSLSVVRVTNIQDELHARDPQQYPRTARLAYTMGREAVPVLLAAAHGELILRAVYHSHPDHEAYFSAEDRTQALGGGDEPNYPEAVQIVISVRGGEIHDTKAFAWDAAAAEFVPIRLQIEEE